MSTHMSGEDTNSGKVVKGYIAAAAAIKTPTADDLADLFNLMFLKDFQTYVVRGGQDPEYLPSRNDKPAKIIYANGFAASVLHEVAHWCIAGKRRRELNDYGYWYAPDGRDVDEQLAFEKVEAKPQALEWLFSSAVDIGFNVSADNTAIRNMDLSRFRGAVRSHALEYLDKGLPQRAKLYYEALLDRFGCCRTHQVYWQRVQSEGLLPE